MFYRSWFSIMISFVLSALAIGSPFVASPVIARQLAQAGNTGACNFTSYVALGDSYSAGIQGNGIIHEGELPLCPDSEDETQAGSDSNVTVCTSEHCAKNTASFAYQFWSERKEQIENFQFLACTGANTSDISGRQLPVAHDADLVTVTIGGNDGDAFTDVVQECIYMRKSDSVCLEALDRAEAQVNEKEQPLITTTFSDIAKRYSESKVAVLGYAILFPTDGGQDSQCQHDYFRQSNGLTISEKMRMNELVRRGDEILQKEAAKLNFTYVDPNPSFEGFRLCDKNPNTYFQWQLEGPKRPRGRKSITKRSSPHFGIFHPTPKGYEAYKAALVNALGCE